MINNGMLAIILWKNETVKGTVKSFLKRYENEVKAVDRLTITGDDYGLRSAFALRATAGQGRICTIVHRNR
jgi:hypothetical protein